MLKLICKVSLIILIRDVDYFKPDEEKNGIVEGLTDRLQCGLDLRDINHHGLGPCHAKCVVMKKVESFYLWP